MDINKMLRILAQQNPQIGNMLNMVQGGQMNMEQVCKKYCEQQGIDFNTAMAQFKQQQNNKNTNS